MKKNIHPNYKDIKVTCSCGNVFITRSTLANEELHLDICAKCHPFYTGQQKMIDTAGRVERFNQRYQPKAAVPKPKEVVEVKAEEKPIEKPVKKKAAAHKEESVSTKETAPEEEKKETASKKEEPAKKKASAPKKKAVKAE